MGNDSYPEPGWRVLGWFYEGDGERRGPFSHEELRRLVAAFEIPAGTKVYVAWTSGAEVEFMETDLRQALGEPGAAPALRPGPAPAAAVKPAVEAVAGPRCPRCRRSDIHPSRARWYDLPAAALGLHPVRCTRCGRRFYRRR